MKENIKIEINENNLKLNNEVEILNFQVKHYRPYHKNIEFDIYYKNNKVGYLDGKYLNMSQNKAKSLKKYFIIDNDIFANEMKKFYNRIVKKEQESILVNDEVKMVEKEVINGELIHPEIKKIFYVNRVVIDKEFRNCGIGTELMVNLENILYELFSFDKFDSIMFSVYPLKENVQSFLHKHKLISFYKRCGYRPLPDNDTEKTFYMGKDLLYSPSTNLFIKIYGNKKLFLKIYNSRTDFSKINLDKDLKEKLKMQEIVRFKIENINYKKLSKELNNLIKKSKKNKKIPKIISLGIKRCMDNFKSYKIYIITKNNLKFVEKTLSINKENKLNY